MFFAILIAKRFIPWPWHTTSDPTDCFKRLVCKGWHCGSRSAYPEHQVDEMSDLVYAYENESMNTEFQRRVRFLVKRGYDPALCLAGFFHMLGIGGFAQNMTLAYKYLTKGAEKDLWACHEALSFHPMSDNITYHVSKAAENGGIWSMMRRALMTENVTESLAILKHLGTAATANWWKKRRSGLEYADAVGSILGMNEKDPARAWRVLEDISKRGNLPAALWIAEGLQTGEIGRINETEAVEVLKPYILKSQWSIDLSALMKSTEVFDRRMVMKIAREIGSDLAEKLESYPVLFE